jgi:hypothetical protein
MRSSLRKGCKLLAIVLLLTAAARAQVNPATQIRWPACAGGNQTYSIVTGTCIAVGTAANPAGSNTQVQFNSGGIFASDPNFTFTYSQGAPLVSVESLNSATTQGLATGVTDPLIYDTFGRYPAGTNICPGNPCVSGLVTLSGNSQWIVNGNAIAGDTATSAVTSTPFMSQQGGHLQFSTVPTVGAPVNYYAILPNTATVGGTPQTIHEVGATFLLGYTDPTTGACEAVPGAQRIFSPSLTLAVVSGLSPVFQNLIHLEINQDKYSLHVGQTTLYPWTAIQTMNFNTPLSADCKTEYKVSMKLDLAADLSGNYHVLLTLPDHEVVGPIPFAASLITALPTYVFLQEQTQPGWTPGYWGSVWMGQDESEKLGAKGGAGQDGDIGNLNGLAAGARYQYQPFTVPTSAGGGWYPLALGRGIGGTCWIDGTFDVTAVSAAGIEQHVILQAQESNAQVSPRLLQTLGTIAFPFDQFRLSTDNGCNQLLEGHLYSNAGTYADTITIQGKGVFEPEIGIETQNGSTPCSGNSVGGVCNTTSITVASQDTLNAVVNETTDSASGWKTLFYNGLSYANVPLTGRFGLMAYDVSTYLQTLDIDVQALGTQSAGCSIPRYESSGVNGAELPIDQVRCSWLVPSGATCNITASGSVSAASCSGGTNYAVTNPAGRQEQLFINQSGCSGAILNITSVSGGAVAGTSIYAAGSGSCSTATGVATYSEGLVALDAHFPASNSVSITAQNGFSLGSWAQVPSPVTGAAVLAGGSTVRPLAAPGSAYAGIVVYTSNHTASMADNGKLVVMNCGSACAYNLPTTQPSAAWWVRGVQSIGSTLATVGLSGGDTFNQGASAPALNGYAFEPLYANLNLSTDYISNPPLKAGAGVTLTPGPNGLSIASTAVSNFSPGCGVTGGKCLYAAGILTPVLSTGSAVTLYSYTLPGGTLTATGCVNVEMWGHHSTGTTTTSLAIAISGASVTGSEGTSASEAVLVAQYCNFGSTGAGGQVIYRKPSSYISGAIPAPAATTASQASTGNLTITGTFTTSGVLDYWTPDGFFVYLSPQ